MASHAVLNVYDAFWMINVCIWDYAFGNMYSTGIFSILFLQFHCLPIEYLVTSICIWLDSQICAKPRRTSKASRSAAASAFSPGKSASPALLSSFLLTYLLYPRTPSPKILSIINTTVPRFDTEINNLCLILSSSNAPMRLSCQRVRSSTVL